MRQGCLRVIALAVASVVSMVLAPLPAASADPGVVVFPGMEIRQGTNVCTLAFVDLATRTGYTAGHCRSNGLVTDRDGRVVGQQILFRDNTPDGAIVTTDYQISDWQTIALAPDVTLNDVLPGGRALVIDPAIGPQQGQPVCHFGVVTGESCGTVEAVNNGWFTMANGVVSQKGDSGGPVYTITGDGRAAIIGMFNSMWGQFPAAVTWQAADQQIREQVVQFSASAAPVASAAMPGQLVAPA
jgi:hypothetical protein